jgi:hypothetical protein
MNKTIWLVISTLALVSLGCSIGLPIKTTRTGPTQILAISEPVPTGEEPFYVKIGMGAGKLTLQGGTDLLAEGSIQYNIDQLKPVITRTANGLSIIQDLDWEKMPIDLDNQINEWNLKLGTKKIDLEIAAGAYESNVDLGGLALVNLSISDGASQSRVNFTSPNPQKMQRLIYTTGASDVELRGLGFANFAEMKFMGGAGNYTLDFSGNLQRDANVSIQSGVSNMELIIPEGVPCTVETGNGLNNVNLTGTWTVDAGTYTTSGSGPRLIITVEMGLGNLELTQK